MMICISVKMKGWRARREAVATECIYNYSLRVVAVVLEIEAKHTYLTSIDETSSMLLWNNQRK